MIQTKSRTQCEVPSLDTQPVFLILTLEWDQVYLVTLFWMTGLHHCQVAVLVDLVERRLAMEEAQCVSVSH